MSERRFSRPHLVPPLLATIPAKSLVLQVYHREIWLSLGPFEEIDADGDEVITREELRRALAGCFGTDPTDELVREPARSVDAPRTTRKRMLF